jgi:ABC-type transporter Mla subunit MlaD
MSDWGKWFEAYLGPAIEMLKVEGFGPFLALLLLAIGAAVLLMALGYFLVFYSRLNGAIAKLNDFNTEEQFYDRFEEIDEYFQRQGELGPCWREFTETIIHPHIARPGGIQPVIRNTSRPTDFFDAQAAGFTTPTLRIAPNIFVGIGLFLTFAGLIAALSTATTAMTGGSEQMQEALRLLLNTISAKFYTSLVALGISIVLTISFKILETRRNKLFKLLNDRIELGMHFVSVEEIAYSQLEELKEQKEQLQQFNTDLAMKLGDHIKTAVSSAMTPVVEKLTSMGENMGQNNIEAMREIGDAIAKNVQGAAGESLGHLSDRLDSLTTVLGDMSANLSKSSSEFENDIANALTSMKSGLEAMASDLQQNASQTSDLLSEKLELLANKLSESADKIRSSFEDGAGEVSGELEKAIQKLTAATDRSADKMEEAVSGINEAVSGIATAMGDASTQAGELAKEKMEKAGVAAASQFEEAGKTLTNALERGLDELTSALTGFEESLGVASKSMNSMNDELSSSSKLISKTSGELEVSVKALKDASVNVTSAISPALKAVESVQSAVRQMDEKISSAASRVADSVEKLETEMRLSGEAWEEHSKKFEGVNENLGAVFTRVNGQIEESQNRMSSFVTGVDTAFRNALAGLQEAVEELADERKAGRE